MIKFKQGYWRTHSRNGPETPSSQFIYDIWDPYYELPFFHSGFTYLQILQQTQNAEWIILGQQYVSAFLNSILNDGFGNEIVSNAFQEATSFYSTFTPTQTLSQATIQTLQQCETILSNYNSGLYGHGRCSDDTDN